MLLACADEVLMLEKRCCVAGDEERARWVELSCERKSEGGVGYFFQEVTNKMKRKRGREGRDG